MTRILIADDILENRYLLLALFSGNGYEVTLAENGSDALAQAQQSPPDLVVTDILMPVMDGFELCRRWKTDEQLRTVPFVFYTATYTESRDEQFALSLGAERFVIKPQKPEVLLELVRDVLAAGVQEPVALGAQPLGAEMEVLRQHNEVLFHKLEKKVAQLEAELAERKRVQADFEESQERLREAHRLAHVGVWDWTAASDTAVWSEELSLIAGIDPALPRPGYTLLRTLISQESWRGLERAGLETLKSRTPYKVEVQFVRADGTVRWATAYGEVKLDDNGDVTGLRGVVRDITDERQAAESMQLLVDMLDVAPVGVVVHVTSGKVVYANNYACTLHGLLHDEFLGLALRDLVAPADRSNLEYRLSQVERGGAVAFEVNHLKRDGTRFPVLVRCQTVKWHGQRAVLSVQTDISERKLAEKERLELEEKLRVSQKLEAIGSLAGGIAHDFNNILSAILSYAGFAANGASDNVPLRDDILEIKKAAERAAVLTRQLLVFSRRQILRPQVVDLNLTITNLQKMLVRVIGENIELKTELAPDLGRTVVDPGQLEQVIVNLVVNARDAMSLGGRITIRTANINCDSKGDTRGGASSIIGRCVQMAVCDTGCGMDPATQQRMFEPFFTTKGVGKGTGLGLSTVYGIVKQSGGDIQVDSELNRGTTFTLLFPRADNEPISDSGSRPSQPPPHGIETVLLVEDEEPLLRVVTRILAAAGYRVLTAGSGPEALTVCDELDGEIQLLLTDVVMPQMGGRPLAEQIARRRPGVKVLYMSGFTDDTVVRQGVANSGTKFIGKPFSPSELLFKVRDALDSPSSQ